MSREDWFTLVSRVCPQWDRKNSNTLVASFYGYKCANYREASDALHAVGGLIMREEWDQVSSRTFVEIREPKKLEKETNE